MRYIEEKTIREITAKLKEPEKKITTIINYGKKAVRKEMKILC